MKIIGHRGAKGLSSENTLSSINKALHHHVDLVELDLRVTKDDQVILHHDKFLKLENGKRYLIKDYPLAKLMEIKPDLISLTSALNKISKDTRFILEVKPREDTALIAATIKKLVPSGWHEHSFIIGSKSQNSLRQLDKLLPGSKMAIIEPWFGLRAYLRAKELKSNLIVMNQRNIWYGLIKASRFAGLELYAYTLNNPRKAKLWQKWGLSGVITDFPDLYEQSK